MHGVWRRQPNWDKPIWHELRVVIGWNNRPVIRFVYQLIDWFIIFQFMFQPKNIDKRVQTSVHYLRKGTKVAVKVRCWLIDWLINWFTIRRFLATLLTRSATPHWIWARRRANVLRSHSVGTRGAMPVGCSIVLLKLSVAVLAVGWLIDWLMIGRSGNGLHVIGESSNRPCKGHSQWNCSDCQRQVWRTG